MQESVKLSDVSVMFRLYHERLSTLREKVFNFVTRRTKEKYEDFWALKDINFSVFPGETVGIIGQNGSGKSTLLKIITNIFRPTSGKVEIHGKLASLLELGAGFHPELTGLENIYLNGSILGISRKVLDKKIDQIVRFAELEKFIDTPVKYFSSGMYVRLGFAIAIDVNPDILVIDEILAVGDEAFQAKCFEKIRCLQAANKTIVLVSHDLGAVQRFCNRCYLIKEGRFLAEGTPEEVIDKYFSILEMPEDSYEHSEQLVAPKPPAEIPISLVIEAIEEEKNILAKYPLPKNNQGEKNFTAEEKTNSELVEKETILEKDESESTSHLEQDLSSLPFDIYQRHQLAKEIIEAVRTDLFHSRRKLKILDLGGLPGWMQKFMPSDQITILDRRAQDKEKYIRADLSNLPFQDDSFHATVMCDVLEHVQSSNRLQVLNEILRVSKEIIIIMNPFADKGVQAAEQEVNQFCRRIYGRPHPWLQEHQDLPDLEWLVKVFTQKNFPLQIIPNGFLPHWLTMMIAQNLAASFTLFKPLGNLLNSFYNKNFYLHDNREPAYRSAIIICKNPKLSKVVQEKAAELISKISKTEKSGYSLDLSSFWDYATGSGLDVHSEDKILRTLHQLQRELHRKNAFLEELTAYTRKVEWHFKNLEKAVIKKDRQIAEQYARITQLEKNKDIV